MQGLGAPLEARSAVAVSDPRELRGTPIRTAILVPDAPRDSTGRYLPTAILSQTVREGEMLRIAQELLPTIAKLRSSVDNFASPARGGGGEAGSGRVASLVR